MSSFIAPENVVIVDAVRADYALQAVLAGKMIYNGIAPAKTPYPYLSLGSMSESARSLMMKQGAEGSVEIRIWDYSSHMQRIAEIYGMLNELLHNNRLSLSAGKMIRCKLELILTGAGDPSDPKIVRGISRCSMWTLES